MKHMQHELTQKILQMVSQNAALKKQVRRLQVQLKFLKQSEAAGVPAAAVRGRLVGNRWQVRQPGRTSVSRAKHESCVVFGVF